MLRTLSKASTHLKYYDSERPRLGLHAHGSAARRGPCGCTRQPHGVHEVHKVHKVHNVCMYVCMYVCTRARRHASPGDFLLYICMYVSMYTGLGKVLLFTRCILYTRVVCTQVFSAKWECYGAPRFSCLATSCARPCAKCALPSDMCEAYLVSH